MSENINNQINNNDLLVNLKTLDKDQETNIRLLPRTSAEAIIETEDKQFISSKLKSKIDKKQDKLGYVPVNKTGDVITGPLFSKYNIFTEKEQFITKEYVDKKIKELLNSAPETLDTLYELANALGNDPNFAATITNLIGNKLDKNEVVSLASPGKILRLDNDGELNVNIKGNAAASSKLIKPINISMLGEASGSSSFDGSKDININISLQRANEKQAGILSAEDYSKLKNLVDSGKESFGATSITFKSSDFVYNNEEKIYSYIFSIGSSKHTGGIIQTYEEDVDNPNHYREILTNVIINENSITIESLKPFSGRVVYNVLAI